MRVLTLAESLLDLFLPRACLGCGDRIPPEEGHELVCGRCRSLLRPPPSPRCPRCHLPLGTGQPPGEICLECADWPEILESVRAAVVMEPPADALVHALKYGGWRSLAEEMGRRMVGLLPSVPTAAAVVPVPTTARRERLRGYNQARALADIIAHGSGRPLVDALERPAGRTQVRLGPAQRRSNVADSFRIRSSMRSRIRSRTVILIDDVLTTGATAVSAAGVLGHAGAEAVHLVTFARALPFHRQRRGQRES